MCLIRYGLCTYTKSVKRNAFLLTCESEQGREIRGVILLHDSMLSVLQCDTCDERIHLRLLPPAIGWLPSKKALHLLTTECRGKIIMVGREGVIPIIIGRHQLA